jgi:hypothetical protein
MLTYLSIYTYVDTCITETHASGNIYIYIYKQINTSNKTLQKSSVLFSATLTKDDGETNLTDLLFYSNII